MTIGLDLILISKREHELRKGEVVLTSLEWEKIIENSLHIIKLLNKAKLNYQIELSRWTHRGKEEILYNKMEACDELILSIQSMEKNMMNYQIQKSKEENKE